MKLTHRSAKAPVLMLGVIIVLLAIGGFLFWKYKSVLPISSEMKKVQDEVMKNCKYDSDFCQYAANGILALSKGYTLTSDSVYNGKKTEMVFKTDGKNNTESMTYVDGKEESGFISLNKTTYMKGPGETSWIEYPPAKEEGSTGATKTFDFETLKKDLTEVTTQDSNSLEVKKVGVQACDKLTCSVFTMTDKTTGTITKVWIDTQEHLARKMEVMSVSTNDGTTTMMFDYRPVIISKPSPVKKMPSFSPAINGAGTQINADQIQQLLKEIPQTTPADQPQQEDETPTAQ